MLSDMGAVFTTQPAQKMMEKQGSAHGEGLGKYLQENSHSISEEQQIIWHPFNRKGITL